ncbi:UNVERIFIED_CONTAM: hypothetical protein PYX00_005648 [Menopon gallinae]|uniref:MACPF domain-containing protein n=1 Tax=Menopon gallinae TaxID=328185 RepID=A0AAW2HSI6_9NEOP
MKEIASGRMVYRGGWLDSIRAHTVIIELFIRSQIGKFTKVKLRRLRLIDVRLIAILALLASGTARGEGELRLGGAINLFSRYGYLSISMKVVPRNDTDSKWLYREPTIDVFKDLSAYTLAPEDKNRIKVFEGDFHMEFCDNLRQLLQAYFRDFSFEKLDRPWRAFSGSWSRTGMAKHLGVDSNFINGHHCYVLVRVSRHRETSRMRPVDTDDVDLEDEVARGTMDVIPGNESSVSQFVKNFGSHYVVSYTTGNSLYQVFVFSPQIYSRIKERLKTKGVSALSTVELSSYFSPWYAEHIGQIQSASGNLTTQAWAAENLRVHFYFFTYPSLLKLHAEKDLLRTLNNLLGNEAMLALDLRTLAPAFKDPERRGWFLEVIDNYLKLWETNM